MQERERGAVLLSMFERLEQERLSVSRIMGYLPIVIREKEGLPGVTVVKNRPASAGGARDMSVISGSGRSPGVGNGILLQYSCLENSMDRRTWWGSVHGVAESWTPLSTHIKKENCVDTCRVCVCVVGGRFSCWIPFLLIVTSSRQCIRNL